MNQGILDTPVGRLSIRQAVGLAVFALLAWITFQAFAFFDVICRVAAAGGIFIFGAVIFMWRVKTVPPERILLLALGIGRRFPRHKVAVKERVKAGKAVAVAPEAPAVTRVSKAQATVGEPVKIVGVLRDPHSGMPLSSRSFDITVDGQPFHKGATDEQGGFEVVYVPERVGVVRIEVKPEGYAGQGQSIEVTARGSPVGGV
jgi:hypothetical protein